MYNESPWTFTLLYLRLSRWLSALTSPSLRFGSSASDLQRYKHSPQRSLRRFLPASDQLSDRLRCGDAVMIPPKSTSGTARRHMLLDAPSKFAEGLLFMVPTQLIGWLKQRLVSPAALSTIVPSPIGSHSNYVSGHTSFTHLRSRPFGITSGGAITGSTSPGRLDVALGDLNLQGRSK